MRFSLYIKKNASTCHYEQFVSSASRFPHTSVFVKLKQRNKQMLNVDKRLTYFCIFCAIYTFSVNNFSLQSLLIKSHLDHSKIRETEHNLQNLRVVSQQCATFFHSSIKPTNCFILLIPHFRLLSFYFWKYAKLFVAWKFATFRQFVQFL